MAQARPIDASVQEEVIRFLADPASYRGADCVDRFVTHGNLVFLTGDGAWKIKRAVRFSYMDFSTLDKRRAACTREIEINRAFHSPLYLGCVPIVRAQSGALAFGRDGEIVEWAVHMRRFDQAALLSNIARNSGISIKLARALADVVYEADRDAQCVATRSGTQQLCELAASIAKALSGSLIACGDVERLAGALSQGINAAAPVLNERAGNGFVRRCHGDLHLGNIVLWQGRPSLYDAIEFDETIATVDTLYDLAFLLMDLDRHNQRPAANIVLNRYLWRSGEDLHLRGLVALPLFLALRAAVRAMVTADRATQESPAAREGDIEKARGYLTAALAYLQPQPAQVIAIGGPSGSGKTTPATALAPWLGHAPGAIHLRTDLERKRALGVGEFERLPDSAYAAAARKRTYAALHAKARLTLGAGHSVVIDAVFGDADARQGVEALAKEAVVSFRGIWLHAAPDKLCQRVAKRRNDASDATPEVVGRQLKANMPPDSAEWRAVDAGGTSESTLAAARAVLKNWEN
jgi:aminoglycoside phosphotransferase family enzyme/predicted kinase